jgi:PAS domain S-box-containing protein
MGGYGAISVKLFGIEFDVRSRSPEQPVSSARENYLSFLLDKLPVGIMQTGLDGRYAFVNAYFCELTGRSADELVGMHFSRVTHPDDVAENARLFALAVESGVPYTFRKRYVRPDGTAVWVEVNVTMLSERPEGLLSVVVDLTERMRAEAQRTLLIDELNHRVKNTLASVQSLSALTMKHTRSAKVFNQAFSARLLALSATHNLLTRGAWERAALNDLVVTELEPYEGRAHARVTITGPPVDLSPRQTISLGMVLHELATNSSKYGALSAPGGRISISWGTTPAADRLRIEWREQDGPPVKPPTRRGFGSRLMERSIAHELGGRFEPRYQPEGFGCTIELPLSLPATGDP